MPEHSDGAPQAAVFTERTPTHHRAGTVGAISLRRSLSNTARRRDPTFNPVSNNTIGARFAPLPRRANQITCADANVEARREGQCHPPKQSKIPVRAPQPN